MLVWCAVWLVLCRKLPGLIVIQFSCLSRYIFRRLLMYLFAKGFVFFNRRLFYKLMLLECNSLIMCFDCLFKISFKSLLRLKNCDWLFKYFKNQRKLIFIKLNIFYLWLIHFLMWSEYFISINLNLRLLSKEWYIQ